MSQRSRPADPHHLRRPPDGRTARPSPRERIEAVALIEEERVMERGVREIRWFVQIGSAWRRATRNPGVEVERLESGPGVVWRRRIELRLARGTLLLRVASSPRTIAADPLGHLARGPTPAQHAVRRWFEVRQGGRLAPLPAGPSHGPETGSRGKRSPG